MSDIMFEILTSIVALAIGAAWYKEFIQRRKLEADLAVEKQKAKLYVQQTKLDHNKTAYDDALSKLNSAALDKLISDTNGSIPIAGGRSDSSEGDPEGSPE